MAGGVAGGGWRAVVCWRREVGDGRRAAAGRLQATGPVYYKVWRKDKILENYVCFLFKQFKKM